MLCFSPSSADEEEFQAQAVAATAACSPAAALRLHPSAVGASAGAAAEPHSPPKRARPGARQWHYSEKEGKLPDQEQQLTRAEVRLSVRRAFGGDALPRTGLTVDSSGRRASPDSSPRSPVATLG